MKTLAAVLVATGQDLELMELEIPSLRPGQVLVELAFSGVCHTQLLEVRGDRGPDPYLPHCLGHEGSGEVVEIGPQVTKCQVHQKVILSWMKGSGADVPATKYRCQGREVNAGGITTFQQYAVVSENRTTPLPAPVDDRDAALLGCAVPTGMGAVCNTAAARRGQSIAVFGTGGIGLCSVAAASLAEADPVIAVDTNEQRLDIARQFGATHLLNATTCDPVESIEQICSGGVDVAIEACGRPGVMQQALRAARPRGGAVVIVGNAPYGQTLQIDPRELNQGKKLLGTWGGDNDPDRDFPQYCQLLVKKKLDLTPLRNKIYPLSAINTAISDLENGRTPRPLIEFRI